MIRKIFILIFTLLMISVTTTGVTSDMPYNDVRWGDDEKYLVNKYGSPEHEFIVPRHDLVGIYYSGIERTYPSKNPEFSQIPIKEMFWHVHDDLNLTCWLHSEDGKWVVISYVFWPPDAKF